jgi:hypothetical protein
MTPPRGSHVGPSSERGTPDGFWVAEGKRIKPRVGVRKPEPGESCIAFAARSYFDTTEKGEELEDIDVSDGSIRFFRPDHHQEFRGRREGDDIKETWESRGGKEREGKWEAERV